MLRSPEADEIAAIKPGTLVVATLNPYDDKAALAGLAKAKATAFAMEFVPRITPRPGGRGRAFLASQSCGLSHAVIEGAEAYGRAMPMMMTAAGTIAAAKVFIMGVGVAGLQAIATARRLGAVVTATDVRPATKEQVESLGAKFLAVEDEEFKNAQTAGGYAKEMSAEYQAKQAELVSGHIAKQDMVITTALIPGRPAPKLVSAAQVASMKPGSVIVDLAIEQGGNVEGAKLGAAAVTKNGVKILGLPNLPGRVAADASALYARNLMAFAGLFLDKEGKFAPDYEDEILQAALVTRDGAVVHPQLKAGARVRCRADATDGEAVDPTVFRLPAPKKIFVLAIFVGYYVVWSVTPALHTPLMAVTNAISPVIIVGALLAVAAHATGGELTPSIMVSKGAGAVAATFASVNIFGGFLVVRRMLAMYKKKAPARRRTPQRGTPTSRPSCSTWCSSGPVPFLALRGLSSPTTSQAGSSRKRHDRHGDRRGHDAGHTVDSRRAGRPDAGPGRRRRGHRRHDRRGDRSARGD